jgi:ABC-2 type transport system ATP-binding protein
MNENPKQNKTGGIAVSVENLEKRFGSFTAVNRINFQVSRGEIFGFLGPNGAGKSTTIRMLCGIITPTSGSGQVGGFNIFKEQEQIKQNIGYMSQKFSLYDDLTVEENIDFYSGIYKVPKADKAKRKDNIIKWAGLTDLRGHLTRILSGGWKQRLAFGCSMIHQPDIIFLDEPTSGVDPIARADFWRLIKELAKEGKTVFVTTHYMDEAENCDRMCLIYKGAIIAMGTPMELKTKYMKNDVLQIIVPDSEQWMEKIECLPGVKDAALFGTAIHVVTLDTAAALPEIEKLFRSGKEAGYKITKIQASLEDVFVSLVEAYDKESGKVESKKS